MWPWLLQSYGLISRKTSSKIKACQKWPILLTYAQRSHGICVFACVTLLLSLSCHSAVAVVPALVGLPFALSARIKF